MRRKRKNRKEKEAIRCESMKGSERVSLDERHFITMTRQKCEVIPSVVLRNRDDFRPSASTSLAEVGYSEGYAVRAR